MRRGIAIRLAGAGAAAVAVTLLVRPRLRRLVQRWMKVLRLGGRTAARAAVHRLRRLRAEPERREQLDVAFEIRSAEDVVATLGGMKGAFMKVGQLLSFVDDGMPEHIRVALSQLQDSVLPMAPDLAAAVVRDELGAEPDQVFRAWDRQPIAAASIGQVHRALLHDGTAVAVKVQYPKIAELMEADLAQLDLGRLVIPSLWPNLDAAAVTAELRARLTEELDYHIEAANQRDFARWYAGHPFIAVPVVIQELTTHKVLTTTFAEGTRFAEFERRDQRARDVAAEAIFRFVFRSLHDHLAFNGDPHPGNYLFDATGKVAFLDFGLVKRLSAADRDRLVEMVRLVALDPDPPALRRVVEDVGYFVRGNPLSDRQIFDFSSTLWSYLAEDRPTTLTPTWASDTVRTFLFKGPQFREIDRWGALPPNFVVLQRITVGLLAILGRLNATANWHRIAREVWLGEGPASPLGELEAAWGGSATTE